MISNRPTRDETFSVLLSLERLGFDDEAFAALHHFKLTRGKNDTIAAHRGYLLKLRSGFLQEGRNNHKVQRRLIHVLDAAQASMIAMPSPDHFLRWAKAARDSIPSEVNGSRCRGRSVTQPLSDPL